MAIRMAAAAGPGPNSLGRYLQEIGDPPTLKSDEETALADRWIQTRDRAAADRLVTSHLRLVVKIANGLRGYGLPVAELISEGNVGLMQAIQRFDPARGFRLSTYALWWIRAAMLEYIIRSQSMVRLCTTPHHRRLFFKLRRAKSLLRAMDDGDLAPEIVATIAAQLDVSESDVVTMNRRLSGPDQSLNAPIANERDGEWQDRLIDTTPDQETVLADRQELDHRRDLLHRAMTQLSPREHSILSDRRLREKPLKLDELASRYGVSRERIRQIEERAVTKVQEALGVVPWRAQRTIQPIWSDQSTIGGSPVGPHPAVYAAQGRSGHVKLSGMRP